MVWKPPALTELQFMAAVLSCVGTTLPVVVPSPSCPESLYPHAQSVPSSLSAMVWKPPALMLLQSVANVTSCVGTDLLVDVPSPNCAKRLSPHAQSVPSSLSAIAWLYPVLTRLQSTASVLSCVGTYLGVFVPSPSCP